MWFCQDLRYYLAKNASIISGGFINSSKMNTVTQAETATGKSPLPQSAISIATTSAAAAASIDEVAVSIAGKVMTASVT